MCFKNLGQLYVSKFVNKKEELQPSTVWDVEIGVACILDDGE